MWKLHLNYVAIRKIFVNSLRDRKYSKLDDFS